MSQTINDMPVSLMPFDPFFGNLLSAAGSGVYCPLDKGDGSAPIAVSSYKYLEELVQNPQLGADWWKGLLVAEATAAAGATVAWAPLVAVSGPLAPFAAIAAVIAVPLLGANRIATLVVCNPTQGDMKMSEIFQDCGVQTGRPVYADVDLDTGSTRSTKPDLIPGMTQIVPGLVQGGVGMYRFEKDLDLGLGFYGTGGAVSWTFTDPVMTTTMALAWLVPETGDPGLGVTADLGKYSSLEDFYNKTAGARKVVNRDYAKGSDGRDIKIKSNGVPRQYPDNSDMQDIVFTIYAGY
jgi:hypothetical protein